MTEIKPGSVLLFKKEHTDGVYVFLRNKMDKFIELAVRELAKRVPLLKNTQGLLRTVMMFFSQQLLDYLSGLVRHKYIHVELITNRFELVGAWFNGVVRYAPKETDIRHLRRIADVYEPTVEVPPEALEHAISKFLGREYDFAGLLLNALTQIVSLGNEANEAAIEEGLLKYYNTPDKLTCSELIARIYDELGYKIERNSEFVTPDDIAHSKLFRPVLGW